MPNRVMRQEWFENEHEIGCVLFYDHSTLSLPLMWSCSDKYKHHIIPIISGLFSFFQKVIIYQSLKDKSVSSAATNLKVNPFIVINV